jgi:hypothetical protein
MVDEVSSSPITLTPPFWQRMRAALGGHKHRFFHRHWIEVDAVVQECTLIRKFSTPRYGDNLPTPYLGAYLVSFTYEVNGITYEGIANSLEEVQKEDRFAIFCNPLHPEQNNTFLSETKWAVVYTRIFDSVVVALILYATLDKCFFRH